MHKIGVLKEIKNYENRVGLCPEGVKKLTDAGVEVFVESSAGLTSGFPDDEYIKNGAEILPSAEKLLKKADLLVKVLPLSAVEAEMVNGTHIVFSLLQLASKSKKISSLLESNATYFAADLLENQHGVYPVLEALSEVAGRLAIHVAANLLCISEGGKGILLSGADIVPSANITILGAGLVGRIAAIQAWTNGANVNILSLKARNFDKYNIVRNGLQIAEYTEEYFKSLLPTTDVLIVAVHALKTTNEDFVVTKNMVEMMGKGSVLIDLSVDQNHIVETSHLTSIDQPTYSANGIIHYCVPNISSTVPSTTSKIYTNKIIPYIEILAKNGIKKAIDKSPELLSSVGMYKGKVTNRIIADRFDYTFYNIFDLFELKL